MFWYPFERYGWVLELSQRWGILSPISIKFVSFRVESGYPGWRWFLKIKNLHLQIWNHIWIPVWELNKCSWLRAKSCSSWAPFSQLQVIVGPSLTSPEWRLFGRSGIVGLEIQNKFLIPIWEMQVGSRALVKLRHSFSYFDQIRIVLGLVLVNPEWR